MGRNALTLFFSIATAALVSNERAYAQSASQIAAEAKFAEGVRLMKADRCEAALSEFRASQTLDPASGTLLDIGYCEERLGRVARAWFAYRQALSLALTSRKEQHEHIARSALAKLEPELAYWALRIPEHAGAISVELDGFGLEAGVWSAGSPIDPGAHHVKVTQPGGRQWERSFELTAGQHLVVEVPTDALGKDPLQAPAPSDAASANAASGRAPTLTRASPAGEVKSPSSTREPHPANQVRRIVAFSSAGAGIACLVGAGVLFAKARHDYDAVDSDCASNACSSRASYAKRNDAVDLFHWSLGVAGAGAALLGVGAAVLLTSRSPAVLAAERSLSFQIDARRAEVTWHGAF